MEKDFENKMNNLNTPNADFVKHQEIFKIGLMNARKSSRIGLIFIIVPAIFVVIAFVKLRFLLSIDFASTFESIMVNTESKSYLRWLVPSIFLIMPLLAAIINLLAISHFYIDKKTKELTITIRYRINNLIVLIVSLAIVISFWIFMIIGYVHFK
jgi:uncharacterized membrane protein